MWGLNPPAPDRLLTHLPLTLQGLLTIKILKTFLSAYRINYLKQRHKVFFMLSNFFLFTDFNKYFFELVGNFALFAISKSINIIHIKFILYKFENYNNEIQSNSMQSNSLHV
jgi:hypothetical protein